MQILQVFVFAQPLIPENVNVDLTLIYNMLLSI